MTGYGRNLPIYAAERLVGLIVCSLAGGSIGSGDRIDRWDFFFLA